MDFEPSEEQEALQASVRAVLERESPISAARAAVETGVAGDQPWKSAVELGWPGVCIPADCGGLGLGFDALGLVVEEHGRALAPGPFLCTVTQFAPLVREAGSRAQRRRWLEPLAAGQLTGALAAGHAAAPDPALRARRDGSGWIVEGRSPFVPDGSSAHEIAVAARVDEGDGTALFVVPREAAAVEPVEGLDRSRPLAHLRLDAVEVAPERVLGTPGRAADALARALHEATAALALEMVGACQALLEIALAHARNRVQFDQPIGAFQAIQHKCADVFVAVEKARASAYFAMLAIAEDDPRRALAASMAKASAGDCQERTGRDAIQIHGGTGFTWECDVHLFVKRAQSDAQLLGTAREHRARIAALLAL